MTTRSLKHPRKATTRRLAVVGAEQAPARFWIGVNLHAARMAAKLTQVQLAGKARITAKTLYRIENVVPKTDFSFATLEAIATALGTTPQALMVPSLSELPRV